MTREQLQQIRDALLNIKSYGDVYQYKAHEVNPYVQLLEALAIIDAELAKPEQEPVAWGMQRSDGLLLDIITPEEHEAHEGKYTVPLYRHPSPQSQPVARVTGYYAGRCVIEPLDGKTVYPTGMAVYSAPVAAQSAEPVAEVLMHEGEKIIDASMAWMDSTPIGTQLYAAPPSREWAELEDDDVIEIAGRCADVFGLADLISEALRTKNTGER